MKIVYLYNTGDNFRFDQEYFCSSFYQESSSYIGQLTVDDNTEKVNFGHIIIDDKVKEDILHQISEESKEEFTNKYCEKLYKDCLKTDVFKRLEKYEGRQKKFHINVVRKNNVYNDRNIYVILPSEHSLITETGQYFNYVEDIPIQNTVITYNSLYDRVCLYEKEKKEIEMKIMVLRISFNSYQTMRNGSCHGLIKEYFIPELNVSINSVDNNLNIIFNPKGRYLEKKNMAYVSFLQEEIQENETKCVKTLTLPFDKAENIYNLIKYKTLTELNEKSVFDLLSLLDEEELDNINDYIPKNNIDFSKIPKFCSSYIFMDLPNKIVNEKFLKNFISHYTIDEKYKKKSYW
jgi:hypothetical protein